MSRYLTALFSLLALFTPLSLRGQQLSNQSTNDTYAEAIITNNHLVPGESTFLWLHIHNGVPDGRPPAPELSGVAINFIQAVTRINSNRQLTQAYVYRISSPTAGSYTIPSITLTSRGKSYPTDTVDFQVHPLDSLQTIPTSDPSSPLKIAWFPGKKNLYQGEVTPLTLKVYAPESLHITTFGLPDPKKENLLAWRFSLPNKRDITTTTLNGQRYHITSYNTTISGIQPGTATFGPTTLRLIRRQRTIDPRFGPRLTDTPFTPSLPPIKFTILPLPSGAPATFQGAIGNFQISAKTDQTTLQQTDTTEVSLSVSGTGNLPAIDAPIISGTDWTIIDTSKVTRGEERRFTNGTVYYQQLLRPRTKSPQHIPPYTFSFFDPKKKSYRTLTTPAIPITITSSTPNNSSPSLSAQSSQDAQDRKNTSISSNQMQAILPFISHPSLSPGSDQSAPATHPHILWHTVPASAALLLIAHALYKRHRKKITLHPELKAKKHALIKLSKTTDAPTFYRRAGRIIDQYLSPNEQLSQILAERDALCFQPDKTSPQAISPARKKEILKTLTRSTKLILLAFLFTAHTPPTLHAQDSHPTTATARQAWKSGNYQTALNIYHSIYPNPNKTPADILYNIGNCHHRLNQPGPAALAWRRALHIEPAHSQARNNLRYIQLAQRASAPQTQHWQRHLANFHRQTYINSLYLDTWLILLSSIILTTHLRTQKTRKFAILIITFASITLCALAAATIYHPDAEHTAPIEQQAIIVSKAPVFDQAQRTGSPTSTLTPTSQVIILATRGPWSHIATFTGNKGWIESNNLQTILSKN